MWHCSIDSAYIVYWPYQFNGDDVLVVWRSDLLLIPILGVKILFSLNDLKLWLHDTLVWPLDVKEVRWSGLNYLNYFTLLRWHSDLHTVSLIDQTCKSWTLFSRPPLRRGSSFTFLTPGPWDFTLVSIYCFDQFFFTFLFQQMFKS